MKMKSFNPYTFDVYIFDVDECIIRGHSLIIISTYLFKKYLRRFSPISFKFLLSGVVLYTFKLFRCMDLQFSNLLLLKLFIFALKGVKYEDYVEGVKKAAENVDEDFYKFFKIVRRKKCFFVSFGLKDVVKEILSGTGKDSGENIKIFSNDILVESGEIAHFSKGLLWRRLDKVKVTENQMENGEKVLLFGHSSNESLLCEAVERVGGVCIGIGNISGFNKKRFFRVYRNWGEFLKEVGDERYKG